MEHGDRRAPTMADIEALAELGSWAVELPDRRVRWSEGMGALHGIDPSSVTTIDDWLALLHPDDRDTWQEALRQWADGGPLAGDHRIVRRGEARWVRTRGRVERDVEGSPTAVVGITQDVTEERALVEAARRYVADAAHELRNPVSAISQAVAALDLVGDDDRPTVQDVLVRQSARLRDLTVDLLDLAKLEADPSVGTAAESVELADAVAGAIAHAGTGEARHLEVDVDVPEGLAVRAAGLHLDRVLVNLLTNAHRHGGSRVVVRARQEGDLVRLEVADDGDGVAPDAVETLFEPFRRSARSGAVGTGLGLAIVARLVERWGGRVSYRAGDPGAVFVVELPALS